MLTYLGIDSGNESLTYESIERFVKTMKTHQNIGDQEKSFIRKAMMDSIALWGNEMPSIIAFRMKFEEDGVFMSVWEDIISMCSIIYT